MNLYAYPRTIKDILTLNRKYIIPRFQREYSWGKTELNSFWNDTLNQIKLDKSELVTNDYFIGALVLVGDDSKDTDFLVVDGQQRLTSITILFSALTETLKNIDNALSQSCYSYVEGKDGDYKPFFKLENENPKPFLQRRIQNLDKEDEYKPETEEESNLLIAYDFFSKKLKEDNLRIEFSNLSLNVKNLETIDLLKAVRDQILKCKTIFITVDNERQAQTIFETLNAKGKDLETIDLIKNKIFNLLAEEHPTDYAKESWKKIKSILQERENRVNISTYFRHFWISNYEFLIEDRIYASFQKKIKENKKEYKKFVGELIIASEDYVKIISPLEIDWKEQESKEIYYSIKSLNDFRVVQHRPLFLTLLYLYKNKLININELRESISKIEKFHFIFTAVCSMRASGLESTYSKYSRELRLLNDKSQVRKLLSELFEKLKNKIPSLEVYKSKFNDIVFTNKLTKDKKLIQYIFAKLETELLNTNELKTFNITLEHIESQKITDKWVSKMGNLLPLSGEINSAIGNSKLEVKLKELKKSELKVVKEFCDQYRDLKVWTEVESEKRTESLAEKTYLLWKL
ncbi:DUF262 domain-containing protein [Flavobacterium sp. CAN_S2]|uniref:DUF262 domain-containing protein n=1 Tax=Flavobacterium sp. CAN_S2 TaxID=2787726 RepID=UPI0018CBC46C